MLFEHKSKVISSEMKYFMKLKVKKVRQNKKYYYWRKFENGLDRRDREKSLKTELSLN